MTSVAQAGAIIWIGRYDGRHRLIQWTTSDGTFDSYTTASGQELEVRRNNLLAESFAWGCVV